MHFLKDVKSCQKKILIIFKISSLCHIWTAESYISGIFAGFGKTGEFRIIQYPRSSGKSGWKKSPKSLGQSAAQSSEVRAAYSGIYPGSAWKPPRTETAQGLEFSKALTLLYCPSKRPGEKTKTLNMRSSLQWKWPSQCVFHWVRKGDKLFSFLELLTSP